MQTDKPHSASPCDGPARTDLQALLGVDYNPGRDSDSDQSSPARGDSNPLVLELEGRLSGPGCLPPGPLPQEPARTVVLRLLYFRGLAVLLNSLTYRARASSTSKAVPVGIGKGMWPVDG